MTTPPKILAFAGSLRQASWNKRVLSIAVEGAKAAGADVTVIDLKDFGMPIYDGDAEARSGLPDGAKSLKSLIKSHAGLLIAAPEHNGGISAVLKNSLDWVSRSERGEPTSAVFKGKAAALVSATPGKLGGLRGLSALSTVLGYLGIFVVPQLIGVANAEQAFDGEGSMKDKSLESKLKGVGKSLCDLTVHLARGATT